MVPTSTQAFYLLEPKPAVAEIIPIGCLMLLFKHGSLMMLGAFNSAAAQSQSAPAWHTNFRQILSP